MKKIISERHCQKYGKTSTIFLDSVFNALERNIRNKINQMLFKDMLRSVE